MARARVGGRIARAAVCLALGSCGGGDRAASQRAAGSPAQTPTPGGETRDSRTNATADAGAPGADAGFASASGPRAREAARHVAEGAGAFARGDFAAAASAFRAAYALDPSPEMAFNLARVYERMGEVTDAVRYFEIVLGAGPEPAQREDIGRRIAALRAYEQRRRDGIAQPPPSTNELSAEGNRWVQNGVRLYLRRQYGPALLAFQQAYQYLQTPELLFNLAATHERLRHFGEAVEFLREYQSHVRGTPEEAEVQRKIDSLEARQH